MKHFYLILFCSLVSIFAHSKVEFVRAMFNSDASKFITIGWNQTSGTNPVFYYDTDNSKTEFSNKLDISSCNEAKELKSNFVRLKNLNPATKYYFYIVDSEGKSRIYNFSTVSDNSNTKLSIIAGGDSRDNRRVRSLGNQMVAKIRPDAVFFNGDFTGIDIPKQWKEWFEDWEKSISEDGRISPLVVTRGNHEHSNQVLLDLFDVQSSIICYSTTFGGDLLNVISLNSEINKVFAQKSFLKSTLKKHEHFHWQIPQYHRPIRSHVAAKKEMETQYKNFVPLFEKYPNVRLCLENDSHTCKVTWPIVSSKANGSSEGFIRDDAKGIVYVGEGCWGAPLRTADDKKPWTRDAEAVFQVNWIFVSKEKIEVRTILYENVAEVESLTDENRFEIPQNLKLWGPTNGTVVEIFKR
jgi:acid phosphatase type 7